MFKVEIVNKKCKINIEGVDYYFHESYIKNGSGYTFSIKLDDEAYSTNYAKNTYRIGIFNREFCLEAKEHNYILKRLLNQENEQNIIFDVKKYPKDELVISKIQIDDDDDCFETTITLHGEELSKF